MLKLTLYSIAVEAVDTKAINNANTIANTNTINKIAINEINAIRVTEAVRVAVKRTTMIPVLLLVPSLVLVRPVTVPLAPRPGLAPPLVLNPRFPGRLVPLATSSPRSFIPVIAPVMICQRESKSEKRGEVSDAHLTMTLLGCAAYLQWSDGSGC
jgi:hypothetical protein